jgi:hypothetical protein
LNMFSDCDVGMVTISRAGTSNQMWPNHSLCGQAPLRSSSRARLRRRGLEHFAGARRKLRALRGTAVFRMPHRRRADRSAALLRQRCNTTLAPLGTKTSRSGGHYADANAGSVFGGALLPSP